MTSNHITFIVSEPHLFFFPAQIQTHFIPSGTKLAQEYLDKCFLQEASNSPTNGWAKSHALRHAGQVRAVCSERPNWPSACCHRHREQSGRADQRRTERARDRQRDSLRETLPCVLSKRSHVCRQNDLRFEGTHGCVLKVHTGAFRMYTHCCVVQCKNETRTHAAQHDTTTSTRMNSQHHTTSHITHKHITHITHCHCH